jgi:CheY-like chemotaxis protein
VLIGLLEDDLAIQEMLCFLFKSEGYEVTVYASAEDCQAALRIADPLPGAPPPDVLLIDFHLARSISGLEIIRQLRATPRLMRLPVILMTASSYLDPQELQPLDVTLLLKPFDVDHIIRLVENLRLTP